jgi:hypothetical protein
VFQPLPVIMTNDERDPDWWKGVADLGWKFIDHGPDGEDTANKHGGGAFIVFPCLVL